MRVSDLAKLFFSELAMKENAVYNHLPDIISHLSTGEHAVDETTYWSYSAYSSQVEEAELHRTWLAGEPTVAPSPVTQAYTNFLLASVFVDDYVVGAAAVLPCYWLYAQTGAQIPRIPDEHPYAAWLHTYHDDEFVQATAQALAYGLALLGVLLATWPAKPAPR